MRTERLVAGLAAIALLAAGCATPPPAPPMPAPPPAAAPPAIAPAAAESAPLDLKKVEAEIAAHYAAAAPEVQEYVRMTAGSFGRSAMWLNEDAFAALPSAERERKVAYLAELLTTAEYGRHLCRGLAEAGALKDPRLVPGLMKVAGYHRDDADYDCRPKWMAVAALARQESDEAVPLLIGLVDHGNQNTRMWARAALSRKTGQDFNGDKQAWAAWWKAQGHKAVGEEHLKAWQPPPKS